MKKDLEREEADPNYKGPDARDPQQFMAYCLSNFTADLADHRFLRSFNGETFSDYGSVEVVFQLFSPTRTFHLYERNVSPIKPPPVDFNDVVYRGRCEFIQAAP